MAATILPASSASKSSNADPGTAPTGTTRSKSSSAQQGIMAMDRMSLAAVDAHGRDDSTDPSALVLMQMVFSPIAGLGISATEFAPFTSTTSPGFRRSNNSSTSL